VDSSDQFGTGSTPREGGQSVAGRCSTDPFDPDPDPDDEIVEWCTPNAELLVVNANGGFPQPVSLGERYNIAYPQSELSTLMALTQFPVFWWNQNLDMLKSKDPNFDPSLEATITVTHRNLVNEAINCTATFPCSAAGWIHTPNDGLGEIEIKVQTVWPRYSKKFLVGHEIGHALEFIWARRQKAVALNSAFFGDEGYDLPNTDHPAECKGATDDIPHGLTTVEWVAAGANEGFAHFIAADAYNDHVENDGKFNYYKSEDEFGFERDVDLSESFSQREMVCGGEGVFGQMGTGVEVDWLRFYWNLHVAINQDHGLPSILSPGFTFSDALAEARAQEIMLAFHAGAIVDASDSLPADSAAYYSQVVSELCNDSSMLVNSIVKLDVDIDAVRTTFFNFAAEFGVWTHMTPSDCSSP
jgi:hypothetical protein